jgi:hypothetical protein
MGRTSSRLRDGVRRTDTNTLIDSNQGRFFFPVIGPISLSFVLGLNELPPRVSRPLVVVAPAFFALTAAYALLSVHATFSFSQQAHPALVRTLAQS